MRAMYWTPGFLDEGPRPKSGKLRLNLTWQPPFGRGKSIGSHPKKKKELQRELMIWGTMMQAKGHFRRGSKGQGPMKYSNLIG